MTLKRITGLSLIEVESVLNSVRKEAILDENVRHLTELAILDKPEVPPAVFDFVKSNFSYTPDPDGWELFIHPKRVALDYFSGNRRAFDCDDYALLTASMLGSVGYPNRIILVDSDLDGAIDHALAQYYSESLRRWVHMDTSASFPLGWIFHTGVVHYVG